MKDCAAIFNKGDFGIFRIMLQWTHSHMPSLKLRVIAGCLRECRTSTDLFVITPGPVNSHLRVCSRLPLFLIRGKIIFTVRKRRCGMVMFYTCLWFCSQGGGVHPPRQTPPPPDKATAADSYWNAFLLKCTFNRTTPVFAFWKSHLHLFLTNWNDVNVLVFLPFPVENGTSPVLWGGQPLKSNPFVAK